MLDLVLITSTEARRSRQFCYILNDFPDDPRRCFSLKPNIRKQMCTLAQAHCPYQVEVFQTVKAVILYDALLHRSIQRRVCPYSQTPSPTPPIQMKRYFYLAVASLPSLAGFAAPVSDFAILSSLLSSALTSFWAFGSACDSGSALPIVEESTPSTSG